jgi:hypothetical protein
MLRIFVNRPPTKVLEGRTPYKKWNKKPDVSHFGGFGCDVWVLNQGTKKSKLVPKEDVFIVFLNGQKAIRSLNVSFQ